MNSVSQIQNHITNIKTTWPENTVLVIRLSVFTCPRYSGKGLSIKDVHSQGGGGGGGVGQGQTFCGQDGEGVTSDVDVRTFWRKNTRIFEIYGVSARTRRGLSQCGHFANEQWGQFFSILCGRLLRTGPKVSGSKVWAKEFDSLCRG